MKGMAHERHAPSTRSGGAWREWIVSLFLAMSGIAGIGFIQPRLAASMTSKSVKRDDVFVLPPAKHLQAMTLGYRAAGADLLWAKLIVEHGVHWEEKRDFPDIPNYLDGILALDPQHPLVYDFVDSLLLFVPTGATEANTRLAREYFERGTRERSQDPKVWLRYGEFMTFLAPSYIHDRVEADRWRKEGALALGHAVDLGADPDRSMAAASILGRAGEQKAQITYLQRTYALTDDPETRREIARKLKSVQVAVESEATLNVVETQWREHFNLTSRSGALLLGPYRDTLACAGPQSYDVPTCAADWTAATRERP